MYFEPNFNLQKNGNMNVSFTLITIPAPLLVPSRRYYLSSYSLHGTNFYIQCLMRVTLYLCIWMSYEAGTTANIHVYKVHVHTHTHTNTITHTHTHMHTAHTLHTHTILHTQHTIYTLHTYTCTQAQVHIHALHTHAILHTHTHTILHTRTHVVYTVTTSTMQFWEELCRGESPYVKVVQE